MKTLANKLQLPAVVLITQLVTGVFPQQRPKPIVEPPPSAQQITQEQKPQSQKPDEDDVVRITTNLVQVDAVVTDGNGKVVTDLKPEEVQITEDGQRQEITNFSYIVTDTSNAAAGSSKPANTDKYAPPVPGVRLKPEDVRRTIALVVDDLGLSFESTHFVRRALKKFVDEQMQAGDLVAIIRTASGMGALQQFTSDKRQLYAAIERVRYKLNGRGGVGAFAPSETSPAGESGPEVDRTKEDVDQFREDLFAVGTLGALSYVVKGLRELPGRKSVLLISDGIKFLDAGNSSRSFRTAERLRRLIDEAGRASVVIYTMSALGLQTTGPTAADSGSMLPGPGRPASEILRTQSRELFNQQEGLRFLAEQTGGIAIINYNDLSRGIRKVLEDQKGYYLIGYRPDEATFDSRPGRRKFHHLSLKVTRKGKFNVRMRNGFYGVTDQEPTAPRTRAQQMFGALTSPFGATGVHLQLTSFFGNDANSGSFMRSMLHIDANDLTFTDEPNGVRQSVFDLLAITFGDNGAAIEQTGRIFTIRMSDESYKRALRQGLIYDVIVPIKKPGAYQLRMALRDTTSERVGSASQFIEVPDLKKNRLTLSGVVLSGSTGLAGANQAGKAASAANAEGVEQTNPESGPAVRHFTRDMVIEYLFAIYNARFDKATNRAQLITQMRLFRDGKLIFTGKETNFDSANQTDRKRLTSGGAIQLGAELAPGEYVLQVVVKDMLASEEHRTASQWIDFEIVK
jgi:VWFA-related protein